MRTLVIAGSPKGEVSVTRQYVRYLEERFPQHAWSVVDVASRIHKLERDPETFDAVIAEVRAADVVLWACPVYVLLVPAGLKRFIELVHERGAGSAFAGKYAASLTTSIHFHDNCAHDYLRAVSEDLGIRFAGSHSPEMYDLQKKRGAEQLIGFWTQVLRCSEQQLATPTRFASLPRQEFAYTPSPCSQPARNHGLRTVILHDSDEAESRLSVMVRRLGQSFGGPVEKINLRELSIKGNCLGCLRCANANHCAYEGKDGFIDFYNSVLKQADLLIFAGSVVDRHLSSRWRQFFERGFFNTHTPSFAGKQLAFVIAGPLSHLANLREVLAGYTQWQEANLVDIVSDEVHASAELDTQLDALAQRMIAAAHDGYVQTFDFVGVGGRKVFRDHIFGPLRFVFPADHRYYARSGFYDFPTRNWPMRVLNRVLLLLFQIPAVRRAFDKRMKEATIMPLVRIHASPDPQGDSR